MGLRCQNKITQIKQKHTLLELIAGVFDSFASHHEFVGGVQKSLLILKHSHHTYSTTDTQKVIKVLNIHTRSGVIVNGSSSDYNGKMETGQLRGLQGV